MKVLELEAKVLLAETGLPVPAGELALTPDAAYEIASRLGGPVVVKAQALVSGRMKAGGIRFANSAGDAQEAASDILAQPLRGQPVEAVLVERRVAAAREYYVGVTYDASARTAVLLASQAGGIEVEAGRPTVRRPFSLLSPLPDFAGREVASALGVTGPAMVNLAAIITDLAHRFADWDAVLLEINPLILDDQGEWWLADARLELDDEAAYRQQGLLVRLPASARLNNQRTEFERLAAEIDSADHRGVAGRVVPFDGDMGLLIGGGGASLTIMDALLDAGLKPANYCEIGGNPSVWKIAELTRLILSQPRVSRLAVMMNVVSNTRVDLVARGVIKGILALGLQPSDVIAVFRVPGSWETEGRALLEHYGVCFLGRDTTIDKAVGAIA